MCDTVGSEGTGLTKPRCERLSRPDQTCQISLAWWVATKVLSLAGVTNNKLFFFPWQVIQTFSSIYLDLFVPPAIKSALKNTFSCLAFLERRWGSQKNKNRWNNKSKERMKSGTLCLCLRQYNRKILLFRSQENSIAWINIFSEPSVFLKVELDDILKKKISGEL